MAHLSPLLLQPPQTLSVFCLCTWHKTVKNLTWESLLPSSSYPYCKVYSFPGGHCYAGMSSWCFRLYVYMYAPASSTYTGQSLTGRNVFPEQVLSLGSTFSLAARGPAAELLLSERAKASCTVLVSFTCAW